MTRSGLNAIKERQAIRFDNSKERLICFFLSIKLRMPPCTATIYANYFQSPIIICAGHTENFDFNCNAVDAEPAG